ncbi:hypothetical protein BDZ97DRAFT_1753026 [Flammula alnicola]|nr:hypothetical protein BDZ97DRAFT_1753026 [Flammula alnicola]
MSFSRPLTRSTSRVNQPFYTSESARPAPQVTIGSYANLPPRKRPSRDHPGGHEGFSVENSHHRSYDELYYFKKATHRELMEAGNQAHLDLFDAYTRLDASYMESKALLDNLTKRMEHAITTGPSSTPDSATSSQPSSLGPKPKKDDFPHLKFWFRRLYNLHLREKKKAKAVLNPNSGKAARGGARLAETGENVATDYIETEDGEIVDGPTAASIRLRLRNIFNEMSKPQNSMALPNTWSDAGVTEREYLLRELYKDFPYIRLCDDDWKAILLAGTNLTAYHNRKKRRDKAITVKQEAGVKTEACPPPEDLGRLANDDDEPADPITAVGDVSTSTITAGKRKAPPMPTPSVDPSKRPRITSATLPTFPSSDSSQLSPPSRSTPPISPAIFAIDPRLMAATESPSDEAAPVPVQADMKKLLARPRPRPAAGAITGKHADKGKGKEASEADDGQPTPSLPQPALNAAVAAAMGAHTQMEDGPAAAVAAPVTGSPLGAGTAGPAPRPFAVTNTFASLFGPPVGPSTRLESLRAVKEKGQLGSDDRKKTRKQATTAATASVDNVNVTAGMKKVTKTFAPKNLYYIEYLKSHAPITISAFEAQWKKLGKHEQKHWIDLQVVRYDSKTEFLAAVRSRWMWSDGWIMFGVARSDSDCKTKTSDRKIVDPHVTRVISFGKVGPINVDDELEVISHNGATDTWDSASLLCSLGSARFPRHMTRLDGEWRKLLEVQPYTLSTQLIQYLFERSQRRRKFEVEASVLALSANPEQAELLRDYVLQETL